MGCNCSKPISQNDCEWLKKLAKDKDKRAFIFHIFEDKGLFVAEVVKGANPNKVALDNNFVNNENQLEWFWIKEHPCLWKK